MMMLAVESTAAIASAALLQDGVLLAEREADAGKKHAETLLPLIDALLEENGFTIAQIDVFAVDVGPGSFTGVRIGVSLVNALAFAAGKQVIPVDSLETLALSAGETSRPVAAMIDARNGNAYAALYQAGEALIEPCATEIMEFAAKLPQDVLFVGDVKTKEKTFPRAGFVAFAAQQYLSRAVQEADPIYLRPSQAERTKQQSVKGA